MRIRAAKSELEEAGEDTDGMAESTAKLRAEIKALSGVDIMINDNTFKSTYKIMEELSEKWKDLTDIQQASIIELMAGKRQGNIFSSLMTNFDIAREALEKSQDSAGSAMEEHEKWMESLQAKLNQLKVAFQDLSTSTLKSDFLGGLIDGATSFINILEQVIDSIGIIKTAIAGIAIGKFISNITSVSKAVGGIYSISDAVTALSIAFPNATAGVSSFVTALSNGSSAGTILKTVISGLWSVIKAHPFIAIVSAVSLAIAAFNHFNNAAKAANEKMKNAFDAYDDAKQSVVDINSELETAKTKITELQAKGGLTFVEQSELEKLQTATELLKIQADLAKKEAIQKGKEAAAAAVEAYKKNFTFEISQDQTEFYLNEAEVTPSNLYTSPTNISSVIASIKYMEELRDDVKEGSEEWNSYDEYINEATNSVREQLGILVGYRANLEAIPKEYLTDDQQIALNKLVDTIAYIYQEIDPAAWKQIQFDKIFNDQALSDAKQELINIAAANKSVGVSIKNVKNKFSELGLDEIMEQALADSGFSWQDLVDQINSEAGSVNMKVVTEQLQKAYTGVATDAIENADIEAEGEINVETNVNVEDSPNGMTLSEYEKLINSLTDEERVIALDVTADFDVSQISEEDFRDKLDEYANKIGKYTERQKQKVIDNFKDNSVTEWFDSLSDKEKEFVYKIGVEVDGTNLWTIDRWKQELIDMQFVADGVQGSVDAFYDIISNTDDGNFKDKIEGYTSQIDTLKEALDKIASSEFTNKDTLDLAWQFPELQGKTDDIDTLTQAIHDLMATLQLDMNTAFDSQIEAVGGAATSAGQSILWLKELTNNSLVENIEAKISFADLMGNEEFTKKVDDYIQKVKELNSVLEEIKAGNFTNEELMGLYQTFPQLSSLEAETGNLKDAINSLFDTLRTDVVSEFNSQFGNLETEADVAAFNNYINAVLGLGDALEIVGDISFADLMNDSGFIEEVDIYIDKTEKLNDALEKIKNGNFTNKDIVELKKEFNELSGVTDNYDVAINNLLATMKTNVVSTFESKFGKLDTDADVEALMNFMDAVLELGEVVGSTQFAIDINTEIDSMDGLFKAMQESKSSTGLTAESIEALKSRYKDLENYDAAKLFEETTNGIRLNTDALNDLEDEYQRITKTKLDNTLKSLKNQYDSLTDEINSCDDAARRAELYAQRDDIVKQINETATLAAQYKGLTSAYYKWEAAQSAGNDRDMYEGIISGKKELEEEMSRGWLDDDAIAYLELLTGQDLSSSTKSIEDQIAAYKKLNETVYKSGYSVWDFFTTDEDGKSTSEGVFNFFDTIQSEVGEAAAWIDENGNYNFDFSTVGGDEAIAEALGISEELVQIILRAAEDAGFKVNLESSYTEFADLNAKIEETEFALQSLGEDPVDIDINCKNEDLDSEIEKAQTKIDEINNSDVEPEVKVAQLEDANAKLNYLIKRKQELEKSTYINLDTTTLEDANDKLIKLGKTKIKFNFGTTDSDFLETQINEAKSLLNTFKNDDGTINLELEGAEETRQILAGLIAQRQKLNTPAIMSVDTSQATTDIENVIALLQSYKTDYNNLEINAAVGADTSQLATDVKTKITAINNLSPEVKASLGLDSEDFQTALDSAISDINVGVLPNQDDLDTINATISAITPEMIVAAGVDSTLVDEYESAEHTTDGEVIWDNNTTAIDTYIGSTHQTSGTVVWSNDTTNVKTSFNATGTIKWNNIGGVNATARAQGTAYVNGTVGKAYKQGDWGTKDSGIALGGEIGQELVKILIAR